MSFFVVLQFCFRFVLQGLSSPWIGHILVCLCFAITRIIRQAYSFCFIFDIKRQHGVAGPGEITIIHVSKRAVRPPPCARRRHTSHGRHRVSAPPRAPSCQPTGILSRYHNFSKFLQSMHAPSVGGHAGRKTTTPQGGRPEGSSAGHASGATSRASRQGRQEGRQRGRQRGVSSGAAGGAPPEGSPSEAAIGTPQEWPHYRHLVAAPISGFIRAPEKRI